MTPPGLLDETFALRIYCRGLRELPGAHRRAMVAESRRVVDDSASTCELRRTESIPRHPEEPQELEGLPGLLGLALPYVAQCPQRLADESSLSWDEHHVLHIGAMWVGANRKPSFFEAQSRKLGSFE